MTAKQWILFGAIQGLGISLVSFSNIHTNVLPFIVGFFVLLFPGILVSSKMGLGGSAQSVIVAVLINAIVWHLVKKMGGRKNSN